MEQQVRHVLIQTRNLEMSLLLHCEMAFWNLLTDSLVDVVVVVVAGAVAAAAAGASDGVSSAITWCL